MKKVLLLAGLALGINASAQIKVEDAPQSEKLYQNPLGLHAIFKTVQGDTLENYSLTFKDGQYQQISVYETVTFLSKQDAIDFFNLIKTVIETEEDKTVTFNDQTVSLVYIKNNLKLYLGDAFSWWSIKYADKYLEALQ
jgi:hypothetical protein